MNAQASWVGAWGVIVKRTRNNRHALQGPSTGQESGRQEIQTGEQAFSAIDFGGEKEAAAIVEHVEHGKSNELAGDQR